MGNYKLTYEQHAKRQARFEASYIDPCRLVKIDGIKVKTARHGWKNWCDIYYCPEQKHEYIIVNKSGDYSWFIAMDAPWGKISWISEGITEIKKVKKDLESGGRYFDNEVELMKYLERKFRKD